MNTTAVRKYIIVDSKKRDSGTTNSFSLHVGIQKIVRLSVVSATMAHSFYNIDSTKNTLKIREYTLQNSTTPADEIDLVLTQGYYTSVDEVMTEIEQQLSNINNSNYSVSFDSRTGKLSIAHVDNSAWIEVDASYSLASMLGYTATRREQGTSVGDRIVDLRIANVFISLAGSGLPTTAITKSTDHSSIVFQVPVSTVGFGEVLHFSSPSQHLVFNYLTPQNLDNLVVSLRDNDANIISNNGADWGMTLIVDAYP